MAGERLVLALACALAAVGALGVPVVRDGDGDKTTAAPQQRVPPSFVATTAPGVVPTTAGAAQPVAPTSTTGTLAKPKNKTAPDPCAAVTRYPPMHFGATFEDFGRPRSQRRILASGSYRDTSWRLSIERDDAADRWNLALAHTSPNDRGRSATSPDEAPLFVAGSSLSGAWAHYGKAALDTKCVVLTTNKGSRVAIEDFSRDETFDDGVFFIVFVDCLDGARGGKLETFDRDGARTAESSIAGYPTREEMGGNKDFPATPEEWCTR